MAIDEKFALLQAERLECFEGFPRMEFQPTPFREYVNALMRCQTEQQCREVVTHFVETATKYPTVAVLLAQIRISTPVPEQHGKRCGKCIDGWIVGHYLSEGHGATPQEISADEAEGLLERIRNTKRCRSSVVTGARRCSCLPVVSAPIQERKKGGRERTFSDFVR